MSAVPRPVTTKLEITIFRCLASHSKLVVLVSSFWVVCVSMMYMITNSTQAGWTDFCHILSELDMIYGLKIDIVSKNVQIGNEYYIVSQIQLVGR